MSSEVGVKNITLGRWHDRTTSLWIISLNTLKLFQRYKLNENITLWPWHDEMAIGRAKPLL